MKLQTKAYKPCCAYSTASFGGALIATSSKVEARRPAYNAGLTLCHVHLGSLLWQPWTWREDTKALFLPSDEDS